MVVEVQSTRYNVVCVVVVIIAKIKLLVCMYCLVSSSVDIISSMMAKVIYNAIALENRSHIRGEAQRVQHGQQIQQACVVLVRKPGLNRDRILCVVAIRARAIVEDENGAYVLVHLLQVLCITLVLLAAILSIQALFEYGLVFF